MAMTRSVVRVDISRSVEQQLDALRCMLEDWAQWQGGYRMRLGYPTRSISAGGGGSVECRHDDLYASADSAQFEAIDAAVDDLQPAQRAAIYRRYGIAAVFRFPRDNYAACLDQAHDALMRALPRKGVDIV